MSMSADVHDTILSFCIENNIPQDKAIALLREIVDDMNGDGDTYDFSFVANVYASSKNAAQQTFAPDVCHSTADGRHLWQNDSNGRYCFACGTRR